MQPQIKEFRFDDGYWRIDWLGGISLGATSRSEAKIVVYLTALTPEFQKVFNSDAAAKPERRRFALVKVDQIALLKIGSVWRDGKRVYLRPEQRSEITLTVSRDQFRLIRFDGTVQMRGQQVRLLDPLRYKVGGEASFELAGAPIAVAEDLAPESRIDLIAIPSSVLFQKTFATSSKAVRRLIYGEIDKIADPNESGFVADEPDTFKITLFKQFHDVEAKAIANIMTGGVAEQEYRSMRRTLVAGKVNEKPQERRRDLPHIRMGLPFSSPVTMTVAGKYLPFDVKRDGRVERAWGFLATEILTLNTSLAFTRLAIERKNNGLKGKNAGDPDLEEAWIKPPPDDLEMDGEVLPLNSDDDPADNLDELILKESGGFSAEPLEILAREKDVQRYRASKLVGGVDGNGKPFDGEGTTGDPTGTTSGVADVDVEATQPPAVPIKLEQVLEALSLLQQRGIKITTLAVSPCHRRRDEDGHIVNFFRLRGGGQRNWRLVASGSGVTRGFVVAQLFHGAVWHYFIDVEHKRVGELSMLHLMAVDGSYIEPRRLDSFMESVARLNGWAAMEHYSTIWRSRVIKHSKRHGAIAFARSIERSLGASPNAEPDTLHAAPR